MSFHFVVSPRGDATTEDLPGRRVCADVPSTTIRPRPGVGIVSTSSVRRTRPAESDAAYRRAFLLFQDLQQPHDAALSLVGQALAVAQTGDWRRAQTLLDEATETAGASPAADLAERLKAAREAVRRKVPG